MPHVREKNAHLWERDEHDWYVEPNECSAALFLLEGFSGVVWDPACGLGRIVEEAHKANLEAFGSDIVSRAQLCSFEADFLNTLPDRAFSNIVMNPPFGLAERFVKRAIEITPKGGKVAALLPLVWVSGFSTKRDWLPASPLKTLFPISPRPSMPPGRVIQSGIRPGNGTKDFAWLVWQVGFSGEAVVRFMNTNIAKKPRNKLVPQMESLHGTSTIEWAQAK